MPTEEYENAIEWLDDQETATVTLHSMKIRNSVMRLAERHPNDVKIIKRPDTQGQQGYLLAHIPASWIRIIPPGTRKYTEEEKEVLRERLKAAREKSPIGRKKSPG